MNIPDSKDLYENFMRHCTSRIERISVPVPPDQVSRVGMHSDTSELPYENVRNGVRP